MKTEDRGTAVAKKARKLGLILQKPFEVSPGVVSYPLRIAEIPGRTASVQADRTFVQSLMKRLMRETRQIQIGDDYR